MQIDWEMIRAEWGPEAPGWAMVPHDWMWQLWWVEIGVVAAALIAGLLLWVEWLFSGEKGA